MLSVHRLEKRFGGTLALRGVTLDIRAGEVHGLVGENGAGKSTLINCLGGVYQPDGGELRWEGEARHLTSPADALRLGISIIHQELSSYPDLEVAENIFMGRQISSRGLIDWSELYRAAESILVDLNFPLDVRAQMSTLTVGQQQVVEIAKALSQNPKVLVMDEPTAALTGQEVADFFEIVRRLQARGVGILLVSHRLEEVFALCDRITVLRDGAIVGAGESDALTVDEVVALMVGRERGERIGPNSRTSGEVVLEARNLCRAPDFTGVSFKVRAGEIVGFAGLVGAGRTEVATAVFGLQPADSGELRVDGAAVGIANPWDAIQLGIAYVPEDRKNHGFIHGFSIAQNVTLPTLADYASRLGFLDTAAEMRAGESAIDDFAIRTTGAGQTIDSLSGGNQQKVVLAKWLRTKPKVLILDEPTRGIDVGSKEAIHRLIVDLAEQGLAIVVISSELPELLSLSDRVVVMRQGEVVAELDGEEASPEAVIGAATGASLTVAQKGGQMAPVKGSRRSGPTRILYRRELGLILALILLGAVTAIKQPQFIAIANLKQIGVSVAPLGIVAIGELLVLLTRSVDLSVESIIGVSAYYSADFVALHPHDPVIVAILLAAGLGLAMGVINGLLVVVCRIPAIVATLGTLYAFRGVLSILSGGNSIDASQLTHSYLNLSTSTIAGVPGMLLLFLLVVVIAGVALRYTCAGRWIYAVGDNPSAARLDGGKTNLAVFSAFALCGLLAGVAGILWASQYGSADSTAATGFTFQVIAAVVIGGVSVFGGVGTAGGVLCGALLLGSITNAINVLNISPYWVQAISGGALIAAVVFDTTLRSHLQRLLSGSRR